MSKIKPIGAVDPYQNAHKPLWVVYGISPSYPQMRSLCLNQSRDGTINFWGYSVFKRSPGYRTDGIALCVWIERNTSKDFPPLFFDSLPNALDYMRQLLEPRCEPLSPR